MERQLEEDSAIFFSFPFLRIRFRVRARFLELTRVRVFAFTDKWNSVSSYIAIFLR